VAEAEVNKAVRKSEVPVLVANGRLSKRAPMATILKKLPTSILEGLMVLVFINT
jgi:hypothetical protein